MNEVYMAITNMNREEVVESLDDNGMEPSDPSISLPELQEALYKAYLKMPGYGMWTRIVARYNERKGWLGWSEASRQTMRDAIHTLVRDEVLHFLDALNLQPATENTSTHALQDALYSEGYLRNPHLRMWRNRFPNVAEHFASDDPGLWMERLTGVYSHVARP